MKTLIVDDEPLARTELRRLLAAFPWVRVVGEAGNIDDARTHIETLSPDLTFLDIEMPGGTGFDLLERLDRAPRTIFTTAYDQYALKAFEVNALDYLLKPVEPDRLAAALNRVHALQSRPECLDLEQLFVRDGVRCWFLPLRDVKLFVAEGNYVRIYWGSEQPILGRSLSALENKLSAKQFFRANRQQIVNLDFIESIQITDGGRLVVTLRGGPEVEISRRQMRLFRRRMSV